MFNRYITKEGESLKTISDKLNISLEKLQKANNLYYLGELRAGSEIILPENSKDYFSYYLIEKGDSIYAIARRYNINPNLLSAMNGLKNEDYIYPGQEILIPKSNYSYYLTAEGDTLDMISKAFNKPLNKVVEENQTIYLLPDQLIVSKK